MKTCSGCGEEKPVEAFHIDRGQRDGLKTKCRVCTNKVKAAWRSRNRDLIRERRRDEYGRHKDRYLAYFNSDRRRLSVFHWKLRACFGITPEQFDKMMSDQGGCCAICGKPPDKAKGHRHKHRLNVDHDHKTGKVRGLLCNNCNIGLGAFEDSQDRIANAIQYLLSNANLGGENAES